MTNKKKNKNKNQQQQQQEEEEEEEKEEEEEQEQEWKQEQHDKSAHDDAKSADFIEPTWPIWYNVLVSRHKKPTVRTIKTHIHIQFFFESYWSFCRIYHELTWDVLCWRHATSTTRCKET